MAHIKSGLGALSAIGTVLLLAGAPAAAAGPDAEARIKELERKLERSIQMIETLQGEVQALKSARASEAPVAVASNEQAAKIESLERQVAQLGSGISARSGADDGVAIHGFADVGLRRSGENNAVYEKGKKGFNLGSVDLYLTPQFGRNVRSLIELHFEIEHDGEVMADVERLQIGYAFNDSLTAWFGRFHTPYGYWNTAFHHGAQIQTSVLRPRFLDFEDMGGILPAHTTGAWATGTFSLGGGRLGYDGYVGNAQRIDATERTINVQMSGAGKFRAMGGFNAWYSPSGLAALRLGLHGLRGDIEDDATAALTRLSMYGGYSVYLDDNWEALAEYYRFNNRDLSGTTGSHQSTAWYAQLGYNFGRLTPYGRLEKTGLSQADQYFSQQVNGRSYDRSVIGLRYDLDPKSALKLELNRTTKKDLGVGIPDDGYNEAYVQYAIRF